MTLMNYLIKLAGHGNKKNIYKASAVELSPTELWPATYIYIY